MFSCLAISVAPQDVDAISVLFGRVFGQVAARHECNRIYLQRGAQELIRLLFVCSHIAAARVLSVWARCATLVGLQQMAVAIRAATRVPRINCWAAREQSLRLSWAAVVLQRA